MPRGEMVMSEKHVVNALIEALANAPGKKREPIQVGRLLAYCQQRCPEWFRSCGLHDREEWIRLLILEGETCDRRPAV